MIPERYSQFLTGLHKAEESVATIASIVTACSRADLAPCDLGADICFRAVGMEGDHRIVEDAK